MLLGIGLAHAASLPGEVVAHVQQQVEAGALHAVVVGVLDANGTDLRAFGWRDAAQTDPLRADDLFEIGSISKTFTAGLLSDAATRGELRLDAPASSLAPAGVRFHDAYTLEQLATHSAGLPRLPCNWTPKDPQNPYADYTRARLWEGVAACEAETPPGEVSVYSNFGYGLLGELLALRIGTDWAGAVRARLLEPLGLADTLGYPMTSPDRTVAGWDAGHVAPAWTFDAMAGAGALRGTAEGLLRWGAAHAGIGTVPAGLKESLARTVTPRVGTGPGVQIGLAWHTLSAPGMEPFVFHNGGTGGFRSFLGFDEKQVVVVLVAGGSADAIGMHLLRPSIPLPPVVRRVALAPAELAPYLGTFGVAGAFELVVSQADGHLVVTATGQPPVALWPAGERRFAVEGVDAALRFELGPTGAVTAVVLEQGGEQRFPRLR